MGDAQRDQRGLGPAAGSSHAPTVLTGDLHGGVPGDELPGPVATSAFRAARQLLDVAAQEAAEIVAEAQRAARARQQEADLLVAKARRVLAAAEAKAAVIVAGARASAPGPTVLDLSDEALRRVVAPDATVLPRGSLAARIDEIVASAVAQAVEEARPASGALDAVS